MSNVHGPLFKSPVGNPRQGIALQRVKAQVRLPSKRSFHAVCVDGFPGRVDLIGTSERRLPSRLQRARPLPLRFCLEGSASSLPRLRRPAAYFGAAISKPSSIVSPDARPLATCAPPPKRSESDSSSSSHLRRLAAYFGAATSKPPSIVSPDARSLTAYALPPKRSQGDSSSSSLLRRLAARVANRGGWASCLPMLASRRHHPSLRGRRFVVAESSASRRLFPPKLIDCVRISLPL